MTGNRKHSKIDAMPDDLKEQIENMMMGDYTYAQIVEYIKSNGYEISLSSVYRHAKSLNASLKQLKMVQENFKAISQELRKYPDLDTSDGIIRLLSHQVLERISNMEQEDLEQADPIKLMRETNNLVRTAAYKSQIDLKNKDIMEAGYEKVKALMFDAMAKEDPELYKKVSKFLNDKADSIREGS